MTLPARVPPALDERGFTLPELLIAIAAVPVVRFNWNAPKADGVSTTTHVVNYIRVSNARLRRHCEGGVLVSDAALARDIADISVTCAPVADCSAMPTTTSVTITATPDRAVGNAFT